MSARQSGLRVRMVLVVLLATGIACVAADSRAGDGKRIPEKVMKKRRSALRSAGGRYITHRKRFPSACPSCRGAGKHRVRRGRGYTLVECKQCVGKGAWVSKKDYREVYFEMRTPAYRQMPDIKDTLGKQYDQARHGNPWPLIIRRYRLTDWEMVDPTHGIVWFRYNASKVSTATYWIYALDESGRRNEWYLYDTRSDGPWPSVGEQSAPGGSTEGPDPELERELTAEEGRFLRAAVAGARATFRVMDSSARAGRLQVRLEPGVDAAGRPTWERIQVDAVRLMRATTSAGAPWQRVEAEWRDLWRDAYGRTALRPRWVSALDQSKAANTPWDSMSLQDQIQCVSLTELSHEGWEPVQTATPEATEPVVPEPAEPAEPVQPPPQPQPSPPTPAPPPPTAPTSGELPPLTAKAKRAGEKGLVRIKELLQAATDAFNDGVMAHKGGSMDLWQEKLSESRSHLEEIKEVWYEEIVPDMPGADEAEQDAVANEHFGEIWDQVSKLESMVRKLSRGG